VATRRTNHPNASGSNRRPATTPEAREHQLIAAAVDLAAKQLADGSASAQVITHYLKLGSSTEQLAQEKARQDIRLAEAKIESMASAKRVEEMYGEALNAMRAYGGHEPLPQPEFNYED
jgi:hypothetical protein